jgi:four helix bundle protein
LFSVVVRSFDHERMEVYRVALGFVRSASTIRVRLGAGRSAIADQLDRASISIPLNIAEGAGELAKREKARFYRIARRSATECAAILDIVGELGLMPEEELRKGREQLHAIVAMLVVLAKRMEGTAEKAGARAGAGAGDPDPSP